jgi:antitoxin component YwqK of YwqJK toxin-antitoxin module
MRIFCAILTLVILSCKDNLKISEKKIGEQLVRAKFFNDSLIEGEAKIYKNNRLTAIEHYSRGLRNGCAVSFYPDGKVYDSVNFINGLENGNYYVFDSLGNIAYTAYYFNGRKIGPETYYDNGTVSEYFFNSFEKVNVYYSSYDFSGKLVKYKGRLINTQIYSAFKDGELANGVFVFFVRPPKERIIYQLIQKNSETSLEKVLRTFTNEIFFDTLLPKSAIQTKYFLKADVFDSLEGNHRIFYEEFIYADVK